MKPWRLIGQTLDRWARVSQQEALANARSAAVECSRRAVQRAEVEQALGVVHGAAGAHPAYAVAK